VPTKTAVLSWKLHSKIQSNELHISLQETSLLLGNLIDVLDEIDDAKGELLNLTSADFGVDSHAGVFSILCFVLQHLIDTLQDLKI
jgi:hypothetical protein